MYSVFSMNQENLPYWEQLGSLTEPLAFDQLPNDLKDLLGSRAADQARLIGKRTGQMHIALSSATGIKDFKPEEFSLHYQRSLFSAMVSLVGLFEQCFQLGDVAIRIVYAEIIGNVVPVVAQGGRVKWQKPDHIHAQLLQVIEFLQQAAKIANAIAIAVAEGFNV